MRKGTLILALLVCTGIAEVGLARAQQLAFSRKTIVGVHFDRPPKWHLKLYDDKQYLFLYRHYGNEEYVPGFFVYSVRKNKWMEIKKLSTENAILGRSPDLKYPLKCPTPVTWDFTYLKNREYVDWPLKASDTIFVPDFIVKDEDRKVYRIEFTPQCGLSYTLTRFFIRFEDLDEAFDHPELNRKEITILVDHYRAPCADRSDPQLCYLVSKDSSNQFPYFYYEIDGFEFHWGHRYQLLVIEEAMPQYTANDPPYAYRLVKILSDMPAHPRQSFDIPLKNPSHRFFTLDRSSGVVLVGGVKIKFINPTLKARLLKAGESAEFIRGSFKPDPTQHNVIILTNFSQQ